MDANGSEALSAVPTASTPTGDQSMILFPPLTWSFLAVIRYSVKPITEHFLLDDQTRHSCYEILEGKIVMFQHSSQ